MCRLAISPSQAQLLDENLTIFQTIDNVATGEMRLKVNDLLGAFMFGGETSEKFVKVLSGGERSRLAMIKLLLEPVNLLILDEPTNHLDMQSKDVLKEAIKAFDGTAIIVSHDREFLDGLLIRSMSLAAARFVSISVVFTIISVPIMPRTSIRRLPTRVWLLPVRLLPTLPAFLSHQVLLPTVLPLPHPASRATLNIRNSRRRSVRLRKP